MSALRVRGKPGVLTRQCQEKCLTFANFRRWVGVNLKKFFASRSTLGCVVKSRSPSVLKAGRYLDLLRPFNQRRILTSSCVSLFAGCPPGLPALGSRVHPAKPTDQSLRATLDRPDRVVKFMTSAGLLTGTHIKDKGLSDDQNEFMRHHFREKDRLSVESGV